MVMKCRTLPMRNWHSKLVYFSLLYHVKINVGHYLWGIDTKISIYSSRHKLNGRTLPMRNWHMLKSILVLNRHWLLTVGHYLWGIDTIMLWSKKVYWFKRCRTLPMRNWHTSSIESKMNSVTGSDITYEELTHSKSAWATSSLDIGVMSRTLPMRNWHHFMSTLN